MIRVASLYLPLLPIERLWRLEGTARRPEREAVLPGVNLAATLDEEPGTCSAPRGGGWRPGARWAQASGSKVAVARQVAALPAHQRPPSRELGRRSEAADHPFKAMAPDDGTWARGGSIGPATAQGPDRPLVLMVREGQRELLSAVCPIARAHGLHRGMTAAHARALIVDLDIRDAEPEADAALLRRLALHAIGHWTPTACVDGPDGLWLDLGGTTHLFGGEARFCARLLRFLGRLGITGRIAIAATPGAAHALARFGNSAVTVLESGRESEALAALPLAALRLDAGTLTTAARFGLERIADLYPMPRGPLARRLGIATVLRLDQARGHVAEPIVPIVPFEAPQVQRRLLEPIVTAEAIGKVIGDLVDDLVVALAADGCGLRAAVLSFDRVDGDGGRIGFGTARATRDPVHLKHMLAMRIERIDPGLGIETMTLTAPGVEALAAMALASPLIDADAAHDIAPLVDRLASRGGDSALFRVGSRESDVPERATGRIGPLALPTGWPRWKRPVRMLKRPELLANVVALLPDHPPRRFVWRGAAYAVIAGDGPERIHGEWWRSASETWATRDYFRVEAACGARFWLFRRGDGVEQRTGDLSWYVHGLFG